LVEHRDPGQRGHPLVGRGDLLRLRRTLFQLAEQQPHRGQGEVGGEAVAGAEGQQVEHGNRPGGRDHVLDRGVGGAHHHRRGQLRQPGRDLVVQRDQAVIDQHHDRGSGDGLADGGDAEDRVPDHRGGAADVGRADGSHLDLVPRRHQAHCTGQRPVLHIRREDVVQVRHRSTLSPSECSLACADVRRVAYSSVRQRRIFCRHCPAGTAPAPDTVTGAALPRGPWTSDQRPGGTASMLFGRGKDKAATSAGRRRTG
jgi:hypothetical protein